MDPPLHSEVKLAVSWVTAAGESCPKMQERFGLHILGCAGFINYFEKGTNITSKYYIALLVHLKEEITKKRTQMKKKKCFHQDCTVDCKTTWIAPTTTLFFRSGPQQVLVVCRPWTNAPGKDIWLQWRSDIWNWGIFWGQRNHSTKKASNC